MTHLDTELKTLKSSVISMWLLVISQLEKTQKAIFDHNKELAHEVKINEKRVDAFELKLNMDCENILALYNPLAIDLRLILAVLKIDYNLERIGDYAYTIALYSINKEYNFDKKLLKEIKLVDMFAITLNMLNDALHAFETDNANSVRTVYQRDGDLDKMTEKAEEILINWIHDNPKDAREILTLSNILKKLERVGDHIKNIATEIIFHTEAKMLHHTKKKKILKELDKDFEESANKTP